MPSPLSIGFLGDTKTTVQVDADLTPQYFEPRGTRVAFDHRSRISLQADFRLDCNLRLSIKQEFSKLLFERLRMADCEIIGKGFTLQVLRSRLTLRVDYDSLSAIGAWFLEEQGLDVTQAVRVDRTISALDRIRGAQTRVFKEQPSSIMSRRVGGICLEMRRIAPLLSMQYLRKFGWLRG